MVVSYFQFKMEKCGLFFFSPPPPLPSSFSSPPLPPPSSQCFSLHIWRFSQFILLIHVFSVNMTLTLIVTIAHFLLWFHRSIVVPLKQFHKGYQAHFEVIPMYREMHKSINLISIPTTKIPLKTESFFPLKLESHLDKRSRWD